MAVADQDSGCGGRLCFAKTSYTRKMSDLAEVSIPTFR
jgi:hypothetical protein